MFAAGLRQADAQSALAAVPAAALSPTTWRVTEQLPATIDAQERAVLAAERPGQVTAVLYSSGQHVAAGTILVKLDDAPEAAQLGLDQERALQARKTLARAEKLMKIAGTSEAALEQAQADVAEADAQIAVDNATLAQLNITAPFAGILGIRNISPGDYVQQGQEVADLTQSAPLRVLFSVPQTEAGGLQLGDPFTLSVAALPGNDAVINGRITALSPQLNMQTNARNVEGAVQSQDGALLPGMYGVVALQTGTPLAAFTLPATALYDDTLGRYVVALDAAGNGVFTAHVVYVTELAQSGSTAIIGAAGLQAGERVVAEGGFKLTDGTSVTLQTP
jgi:RND family efflux transporter MFP subunit